MGRFLTVNFYELQSRNRWRTFYLLFFFVVVLLTLGWTADQYTGAGGVFTVIAVLYAGIQSLVSYFWGDKMVLRMVSAVPANPNISKERELLHVVEEMAIAAGLPMPKVYVIPDPSPNAFATGRDPDHASVAVTQGLLDLMNREELQGVIAHEISHIRHRDILVMTLAATLAGAIVVLADLMRRWMFYAPPRRSRSSRRQGGGGGVIVLLALILVILAPLIARLLALAVSRSREYLADAGAAELTRNPLGLARALEKIALSPPMKTATTSTAHLFIADPTHRGLSNPHGSLWSNLWATHPPITERIALLKAMAGMQSVDDGKTGGLS